MFKKHGEKKCNRRANGPENRSQQIKILSNVDIENLAVYEYYCRSLQFTSRDLSPELNLQYKFYDN